MKNGKNVWYILTDVDDPGVAAELGLNFSAKMSFMGNAVRTANLDHNADLVSTREQLIFRPYAASPPVPQVASSLQRLTSLGLSVMRATVHLCR